MTRRLLHWYKNMQSLRSLPLKKLGRRVLPGPTPTASLLKPTEFFSVVARASCARGENCFAAPPTKIAELKWKIGAMCKSAEEAKAKHLLSLCLFIFEVLTNLLTLETHSPNLYQ